MLIVGGLGFLGSNLAHALSAVASHIHLFDSLNPPVGESLYNVEEIAGNIKVTLGDIHDNDALAGAISEAQFIFNLVGQCGHWDSMVDPQMDLDFNCRAQLSLLETIRRTNPEMRIVYASTRQVYGVPLYLPVDEDHPLQPVDVNGIHKIASESYHMLYARVYGLRPTILRLTNTIGPRMRVKDASQTFAGLWIRRAIEGLPFEVWGGNQIRDINYVDDVVDAFLRAAASDHARGRTYNLGASPITLLELADILRHVTGCGFEVKTFPDDRKSIDIGDYHASLQRIHSELGWLPQVSVREAILRTVAYYREHLHRYV